MYSQNNEEEIILNYFKDTYPGKFIDIGAFNPFAFSNTRCLVEKGWTGVFVEPSPIAFKSFEKEYTDGRHTLINSAIGYKNGELIFHESNGDALSTSDIKHKKKWQKAGVKFNEITVPVIAMSDFIDQYGHDCLFLDLDVEGVNYELFQLIPDWFLNECKLICIEHDGKHFEILNKLILFGFKKLSMNKENLIMG